MTDAALIPVQGDFSADIAVSGRDLLADGGMNTAILISLFTDARAADDDALPQAGGDRRGWWADAYPEILDDRWGSKLWLLAREKDLPATLARAQQYAADALAWMIDDGVAASVDVVASSLKDNPELAVRQRQNGQNATDFLVLAITVTRPDGPGRLHYDYVWKYA